MFPIAVTTYDYTTPCSLLCCPLPPALQHCSILSCRSSCHLLFLCAPAPHHAHGPTSVPPPCSYYAPLQWYCFCQMCLLPSPVYTFPPALYCVQGCNVLTAYKKMKDLPLCITVTCIFELHLLFSLFFLSETFHHSCGGSCDSSTDSSCDSSHDSLCDSPGDSSRDSSGYSSCSQCRL